MYCTPVNDEANNSDDSVERDEPTNANGDATPTDRLVGFVVGQMKSVAAGFGKDGVAYKAVS